VIEKARERIKILLNDIKIDENRIAMEVAILAERYDITEECERLRSHFKQAIIFLESNESAGKKLNFLIQEMNREANTIGSKASTAEITFETVYLKEELEKIREQIQNIE
jgi:uncharacterized protein (TIGR00255 family)